MLDGCMGAERRGCVLAKEGRKVDRRDEQGDHDWIDKAVVLEIFAQSLVATEELHNLAMELDVAGAS